MIDFSNGKKKQNYKETSSAQFSKYIDKINTMHPTPNQMYPGQFADEARYSQQDAYTDTKALKRMQAQQLHQQLTDVNKMSHITMQDPSNIQRNLSMLDSNNPPQGYLGVPQYNPYRGYKPF